MQEQYSCTQLFEPYNGFINTDRSCYKIPMFHPIHGIPLIRDQFTPVNSTKLNEKNFHSYWIGHGIQADPHIFERHWVSFRNKNNRGHFWFPKLLFLLKVQPARKTPLASFKLGSESLKTKNWSWTSAISSRNCESAPKCVKTLHEQGIVYNLPFRNSLQEMLEFEFGTPQVLLAEHDGCQNQTAVTTFKLFNPSDDNVFRLLRYEAGEKDSKKIVDSTIRR